MNQQIGRLVLVAAAFAGTATAQSAEATSNEYAFTLPDAYGQEVSLADFDDAKVVVVAFLGVECPLSKLYGQRLAELHSQYVDRGVAFLAIDANRQDALTEMAAFSSLFDLGFPFLKDLRGEVLRQFLGRRNPEVFVLDAARRLRYRGRIDDQYGVGFVRDAAEHTELRDALDALLAGEAVSVESTEAVGCVIGRPRAPNERSNVTYSDQVARVLQNHCVECHRAGEIGPFAMTEYEEVAGWAEMMAEVVRDGRMPPWHADPAYGHYQGERLMSDEEKQILYDWAAAGAPEGDPAELPEPRRWVDGWRLPREPDLVVPMRSKPFRVPATGVIEYQYFAVDPGFTEDAWVQAADVSPGHRGVVHHVIVFISPPLDQSRRGLGWLTAYVPGQSSMSLPAGQARLIPAGSKLIFQMHYTPVGSEVDDLTRLGLVFADAEEVTEEVVTLYAVNGEFEIPPGAGSHRVEAKIDEFPEGARLLGMAPHMHVRGKSFRFTGVQADGRRQVLLDVPRYDFNWQNNFRLLEPIETTPGFAVECVAHFDNSERNLVNPDPTASVRWGDQTFQEMMIAFFEVAVPRGSLQTEQHEEPSLGDLEAAEQLAKQVLARYDADGDGVILRGEVPEAFALFAFVRYDLDGDRRITADEVRRAARD